MPVSPPWSLTIKEWSLLKGLKRPDRVQRFLDEDFRYQAIPSRPRCRSPRVAIRDGIAHCMSGALLGAAALRVLGYPPLLLDLEARRDDDHVLALFRGRDGCWGAVAKSDYAGLRYREPVYRTLRELVMSCFEHYYNPRGERTLRAYSTRPIHLGRFDKRHWMTSEDDVWFVAEYLTEVPHTPLLTSAQLRSLTHIDDRLYRAGRVGGVGHAWRPRAAK
jgi:hypothetical protein